MNIYISGIFHYVMTVEIIFFNGYHVMNDLTNPHWITIPYL
jgi:hypothetical protein